MYISPCYVMHEGLRSRAYKMLFAYLCGHFTIACNVQAYDRVSMRSSVKMSIMLLVGVNMSYSLYITSITFIFVFFVYNCVELDIGVLVVL